MKKVTNFSRDRCCKLLLFQLLIGEKQLIHTVPTYIVNGAVTVACHAIPASGRLVDVDIPELSESPWSGIDIFCTSMGLGGR